MKIRKLNKIIHGIGLSSICLFPLSFPVHAAGDNSSVLEQLFTQAQYWHEREHPDDAQLALKKILSVEPGNTDALYLMALYTQQQGKKAEAAAWKAKLRQADPDGAKIAQLEGEASASAVLPGRLAEARRLSSHGNNAAAVTIYEELFKQGQPKSSLSSEYYQTLASIPERRPEAIDALSQLHQQHPHDVATTLALGKILTYQEESRRDGITLLETLSHSNPEAKKNLRQALLWLHPNAGDRPLFENWLQQQPDDREIGEHYSQNVTGSIISNGYKTVENGQLDQATTSFEKVLEADPGNSNALGGLGIIAMRKGNFTAASDYLKRAAAQNGPDKEKWMTLYGQANFYGILSQAKAQANNKDWDSALATSEPLLNSSGDERHAVDLFRADILRRRGDLPAAEQAYRTLAEQAPSADVMQSLYYVLKAEHKTDDAANLLKSMPPAFRQKVMAGQPASIDPIRRQAAEALSQGETQRAEQLLRSALQKEPSNPWLRLDLARVLQKQGDSSQALSIISSLADSPRKDSLTAAAIFLSENKKWEDTATVLSRIPRSQWTKEMSELNRRATFNQGITRADSLLAGGDRASAAEQLLALSRIETLSAADAGHLAESLYKAGQTDRALGVIHHNLASGLKGSVGDYAQQINVLNSAGLASEANQILSNPALLARSSQQDITHIKMGEVINKADRLREQGQYADAYDMLIVQLHQDPHNKDLMLAMARVYQSGNMSDNAGSIYQYVLSQDPQNQDARTGAIDLALKAKDNQRAMTLMQGLKDKNSPENLFLAARVARSNGESKRALGLLRQAKQQLLGIASAGNNATIDGLPISDNPFVNKTPIDTRLPWQVGGESASGSSSPVSSSQNPQLLTRVTKMLNETREKLSSWVETNLSLRDRNGDDGLGALSETKASLAFSTVPFDESRLKFAVTPVLLNAGSTSGKASNRFGTGALQQANAAWRATQSSQALADNSKAAASAARKALEDKSNARIKACQSPTSAACEVATHEETDAQDAYNLAQEKIMQPQSYGPDDFPANSSGEQRKTGTELSVALSGDSYQADLGTTPLGGEGAKNLVGGLRWSPTVATNTQLTFNLERRAVTDSLLSYVGTKDKYSGKTWGAVVKSGGGLSLSYDDGDAGAYGGASYYKYQGENVADNSAVMGNAGFYYRPLHTDEKEIKVGINADYMNYAENLSNFSFGQGGYFSPQNYISLSVPVEYSRNAGDWSYKLSGAVGYQTYSQKQSDYFPTESEWQNNLDWLVDAGFGEESHYAAKTSRGVSYNVKLQGNYKLSPQMSVGGALGYDTVGEYSEANAQLYLKYSFDDK